jgi:capsule polysaccharide export protein KpsE/RkpR
VETGVLMNNLEKQARKYIMKYANKPINKATKLPVAEGRSIFLSIFPDRLNCFDVYATSEIISSILGPYEQPTELSSYFRYSKIIERLYILFGRYVSDRTL